MVKEFRMLQYADADEALIKCDRTELYKTRQD